MREDRAIRPLHTCVGVHFHTEQQLQAEDPVFPVAVPDHIAEKPAVFRRQATRPHIGHFVYPVFSGQAAWHDGKGHALS